MLFTDVGSNNSGYYTLQAVLTHRGRSSSSGHYVAWVRQKGEVWLKCDDDVVSPVTSEDVLKLSGGGELLILSLIYKPREKRKEKGTLFHENFTKLYLLHILLAVLIWLPVLPVLFLFLTIHNVYKYDTETQRHFPRQLV